MVRPSELAHMGQIMKMAYYREVATDDVRKRLRRLLEAKTKPLIMDLLHINQGGFIQIFKMRERSR